MLKSNIKRILKAKVWKYKKMKKDENISKQIKGGKNGKIWNRNKRFIR